MLGGLKRGAEVPSQQTETREKGKYSGKESKGKNDLQRERWKEKSKNREGGKTGSSRNQGFVGFCHTNGRAHTREACVTSPHAAAEVCSLW